MTVPNTRASLPLTTSPQLSAALHHHAWERFDGLVLRGHSSHAHMPALHEEARALLAQIEQALTPLPAEESRRQLTVLVASLGQVIANPPSAAKLRQWVEIAALAMEDIPRHAWGKNALQRAMQRFTFMPTPAELHSVLDEVCHPLRDTRAQLRRFLRPPSPIRTSHDFF